MLSTLVLVSTGLAYIDDMANLAGILGKLEAAPEDELAVSLGKYRTCPGARNAAANIHTMAQMSVTFTNSCADVAAEIQARGNGQSGWTDPHNAGKYAVESANANMLKTKRRTGNGRYTDVQTFALSANGSGCTANICSESQGTSANDGGTNLCDMQNLFCNSSEKNAATGVSCKPVKTDLQYTINKKECGRFVYANNYAGHRCQNFQATCLKVQSQLEVEAVPAELEVTLGKFPTCPGAKSAVANIHTTAQMEVNFENSCSEVAAEIQARGNMQGGWTDPHNNGKYSVLNSNANLIKTQRRTGNGRFTDVQTFSLAANGSGCTAQICSESQGTSAADGGTNVCDMFNLFCNSSETNAQTGVSCKPIKSDLKYSVASENCGSYVFNNYRGHRCQNAQTTCLKTGGNSLEAPMNVL